MVTIQVPRHRPKYRLISLTALKLSPRQTRAASAHTAIRLLICREVYLWITTDIPISALVRTDTFRATIRHLRVALMVSPEPDTKAVPSSISLMHRSRMLIQITRQPSLRKALTAKSSYSPRLPLHLPHHWMTSGSTTSSALTITVRHSAETQATDLILQAMHSP